MAQGKSRLGEPLRASSSPTAAFELLFTVVVLVMVGATATAAPRDDDAPDRITAREIEIAIRAAMPLPVASVVFIDEGTNIGVAANLDTKSVPGAKDQTMYVKFSVEKSASRQRVREAIHAATEQVRAFIADPTVDVGR